MNEVAMQREVEETGVVAPEDIPVPVGWQVLVKPYKTEQVSQGGIVLADSVQDANNHLNVVGEVIAMGNLCYSDDRFRQGDRDPKPFCKVGDFVMYGTYVGTKFTIYDDQGKPQDFLLLNDDNIKAVVKTPKKIRAYV
jgi:co-chaperonin GroES (HSP10)